MSYFPLKSIFSSNISSWKRIRLHREEKWKLFSQIASSKKTGSNPGAQGTFHDFGRKPALFFWASEHNDDNDTLINELSPAQLILRLIAITRGQDSYYSWLPGMDSSDKHFNEYALIKDH